MKEDIKKAFEKACDESAIDRYIKLFNIIKGNPMKEDPKMIVCPECGGEGVIRNPNPGISDFPPIVDCDHCHGLGKIEEPDNV